MILKELILKNFGKFSGESFLFGPGIHVIYGPNEAGKTTIYHAIGGLLFGIEKQRGRAAKNDTYTTYQPWENKTWYEGALKFQCGDKDFLISRNFYQGEKSAHLICETDGEELSIEQGDLAMLLGDVGSELFYNTAGVGQTKMKPQDIVYSYLKNFIAGAGEEGSYSTDVVKAIEILETKRKILEQRKKKETAKINEKINEIDIKLEHISREAEACKRQRNSLLREMEENSGKEPQKAKGLFQRLILWLKNLFGRKKRREEENRRKEERIKKEEKLSLLQELIGEKESLQEELNMEKDSYYEKLHQQSKEEEFRAIDLAMDRILQLSSDRRTEIMEQLLKKSSAVLEKMTKGKYKRILLGEHEEPVLWDGRKNVKMFQLSTGTVEQIYLSLRIGLGDLFFGEETMPLLFDDSFVFFDDSRLERILTYFAEIDRQVLIFSCHKREMRILEKCQISYEKTLL